MRRRPSSRPRRLTGAALLLAIAAAFSSGVDGRRSQAAGDAGLPAMDSRRTSHRPDTAERIGSEAGFKAEPTLPGSTLNPSMLGSSVVSVNGTQLLVQKRMPDGVAPASAYTIRAVNWSPASRGTNTTPTDPANANVRRPEFGIWYQTDIPLMKAMNVNTVRLYIDPGFDAVLGRSASTCSTSSITTTSWSS